MKTQTFALLLSAFVLTIVGLVPEAQVSAHGEGMTLSATSTTENGAPYIVDVDYADTVIVADTFGRFDFNLFSDAERTKPVSFTDLWVRIEQKKDGEKRGRTLYAGSVAKMKFGGTGFGIILPEGGQYTMSVRYNDASRDELGETVAEAEFPLEVLRGYDENKFNFGMEFWVGLIGGLFMAVIGLLPILMRQKKE